MSDEVTPPAEGAGRAAGKKPAQPRTRSPRSRAAAAAAGEKVAPSSGEAGPAAEGAGPAAGKKPPRPRSRAPHPRTEASRPAKKKVTAAPDAAGPGGEIAGYRLEEQIGEGGMAVVYRAQDERLGRRVALKLLAPGLASDTGFRQRFIRESRAAAAVDHPNIIPIYEAGDAGGSLFIAMRYVQGGDVRSLLERGGPLPAARAWGIINQVAAALDAAHAHGLIHRDVKPANMLLDARAAATGQGGGFRPDEQPEHVYLSDFGISKQPLAGGNLTMTGQFVGTLDYIAPEQIDGHDVDGRADLYSLGCAAYELLSGTPPFRGGHALALVRAHLSEPPPSVTAQRSDLPPAVDSVLAGAMAKSPDGRYATCAQFATDLGRALGLVPGEPEPPGPARASSGPGAGDQPQPWPATEPAGQVPAPAASPAQELIPGGQHDDRPPQGQPAAPPAAPGFQQTAPGFPQAAPGFPQAASAPGTPYPGTVQSGQQAPAGGTWPAGSAGSSGPPGPYNPYNPYAPGWQQPQQQAWPQSQPPARRSRGLIAGIIVAVVAVAAAAVAVVVVLAGHKGTSPSANTSPTTPVSSTSPVSPASSPASSSASAEANDVSSLLTSNSGNNALLSGAIQNVRNCIDVPHSVQQIQRVRNQRQVEYNNAQGLSTSALPNGAALMFDLTKALYYSLRSDNDYLTWAQQQQFGCQPSQFSAGNSDTQASNYKNMFVNLWSPIAAQYGLPQTSTSTM